MLIIGDHPVRAAIACCVWAWFYIVHTMAVRTRTVGRKGIYYGKFCMSVQGKVKSEADRGSGPP